MITSPQTKSTWKYVFGTVTVSEWQPGPNVWVCEQETVWLVRLNVRVGVVADEREGVGTRRRGR